MSIRTRWIGTEGAAFERCCIAFEGLGYTRPQPDRLGGDRVATGGYASNIAAQYASTLTERQALAIIRWSQAWGRDYLRSAVTWMTVAEITESYGND